MGKLSRFRRAVVTGGAGFIGSHLCDELLGQGIAVVCVDNLVTGSVSNIQHLLSNPDFRFLQVDVTLPFAVAGRVDLVLHFASPASPVDYARLAIETLQVGSQGTLNALELARASGARFVFASTSEVYGDPEVNPQPETYWGRVNTTGPRSMYDEAKRFGEALVTAHRDRYGTDTAIVRLFNTYGPRMRPDDGRIVPTFLGQALRGEPLTVAGDGRQTRSLCYVDDTVGGVLSVAESEHAGPMNIGCDEELTVATIAERIRERAGSLSPIVFIPRPVDDPEVRRPDLSLIESELAWRPSVALDDGIDRMIAVLDSERAARREIPA